MAHTCFTEGPGGNLSCQERGDLLEVARISITHGLKYGKPFQPDLGKFQGHLLDKRACFVTLNLEGELRGCIGHLQAIQPLVSDVAENAFAAAFRDPRFAPLSPPEARQIEIHISVLSVPEPMSFSSEQDLLAQIRPGIDGLILEDGWYRGTFLPSVWEQLPEREDFWRHLKGKAGLPVNHWSANVKVSRYTTESFS